MTDCIHRLFSLKGTAGIVTGGSSGLGLAMAQTLVAAGARIHALSRTGKPKHGGRTLGLIHHQVDITNTVALANVVQHIGRGSGIDFVVNNAGITVRAPFARSRQEDWKAIQELNVSAAACLSRLAYPWLKKSRHPGRVLFITSMAAHLGFAEVVPYCASKAAVLGLMRGLSVEWARDGILVNSVAPGWFASAMTKQVLDRNRTKKVIARMPLHRFGEPAELTAAVVFLLSPAASYITGHDLAVDGGALAFGF